MQLADCTAHYLDMNFHSPYSGLTTIQLGYDYTNPGLTTWDNSVCESTVRTYHDMYVSGYNNWAYIVDGGGANV